ncbi:MAG: hypothetical protein AAFZ15_00190 [Bacteroidota bacterium]
MAGIIYLTELSFNKTTLKIKIIGYENDQLNEPLVTRFIGLSTAHWTSLAIETVNPTHIATTDKKLTWSETASLPSDRLSRLVFRAGIDGDGMQPVYINDIDDPTIPDKKIWAAEFIGVSDVRSGYVFGEDTHFNLVTNPHYFKIYRMPMGAEPVILEYAYDLTVR